MSSGKTKSAIDSMRRLTLHIDEALEALMDAHGFALTQMTAGQCDATAHFSAEPATKGTPWRLRLTQPADGRPAVTLGKGTSEQPALCLSLVVDGDEVTSVAEAVGLAVSFVAFSEQMRASS